MKSLKERLDAASDDSPDSRISQSELISIMDIHIVDLNAAISASHKREIALEERVKELSDCLQVCVESCGFGESHSSGGDEFKEHCIKTLSAKGDKG